MQTRTLKSAAPRAVFLRASRFGPGSEFAMRDGIAGFPRVQAGRDPKSERRLQKSESTECLVPPFPSPQPSPQGRGRTDGSAGRQPTRSDGSSGGITGSLSLGERVGVRGKGAREHRPARLLQSLPAIRSPKAESLGHGLGPSFRASGFGFLSDFDPRPSNFAIASWNSGFFASRPPLHSRAWRQPPFAPRRLTRPHLSPLPTTPPSMPSRPWAVRHSAKWWWNGTASTITPG
jgi:hypothetical protein